MFLYWKWYPEVTQIFSSCFVTYLKQLIVRARTEITISSILIEVNNEREYDGHHFQPGVIQNYVIISIHYTVL